MLGHHGAGCCGLKVVQRPQHEAQSGSAALDAVRLVRDGGNLYIVYHSGGTESVMSVATVV